MDRRISDRYANLWMWSAPVLCRDVRLSNAHDPKKRGIVKRQKHKEKRRYDSMADNACAALSKQDDDIDKKSQDRHHLQIVYMTNLIDRMFCRSIVSSAIFL